MFQAKGSSVVPPNKMSFITDSLKQDLDREVIRKITNPFSIDWPQISMPQHHCSSSWRQAKLATTSYLDDGEQPKKTSFQSKKNSSSSHRMKMGQLKIVFKLIEQIEIFEPIVVVQISVLEEKSDKHFLLDQQLQGRRSCHGAS